MNRAKEEEVKYLVLVDPTLYGDRCLLFTRSTPQLITAFKILYQHAFKFFGNVGSFVRYFELASHEALVTFIQEFIAATIHTFKHVLRDEIGTDPRQPNAQYNVFEVHHGEWRSRGYTVIDLTKMVEKGKDQPAPRNYVSLACIVRPPWVFLEQENTIVGLPILDKTVNLIDYEYSFSQLFGKEHKIRYFTFDTQFRTNHYIYSRSGATVICLEDEVFKALISKHTQIGLWTKWLVDQFFTKSKSRLLSD